jgi:hypothetical protein
MSQRAASTDTIGSRPSAQRAARSRAGLLLGSALLLTGCQGSGVWGSLALLAVSVGIFVSTIGLRK